MNNSSKRKIESLKGKIEDFVDFLLADDRTKPTFDDHKVPFDRLIIEQAISENLTMLSSDRHFHKYNIKLVQN